VPAIERAIRATTWNTPAVTTAIACRWLEDGTVSRLEAGKRADASARQSIAREALAGLAQTSHPASYFVWLPLPEGARADRVAASLAREHIAVATAEPFAISAPAPQAVRLALGSTDLDTLRSVLGRVRQVVEADAYS
jgi:DNA-binding transcriptional MocR family regulator